MRNRRTDLPEMEQLERYLGIRQKNSGKTQAKPSDGEAERDSGRHRGGRTFFGTVSVLIVVAAIAVLISMLWMPVLRIYGTSMTPTLSDGEIVVAIKGLNIRTGDIVACYSGNKLLVKRCIAKSGEYVSMDENGNFYIDGILLDENYLTEKAVGDCDIEFPYQVPDGKYFIVGDHRTSSVDSRSSAVGCISTDEVVGVVLFRIWPLEQITFFR